MLRVAGVDSAHTLCSGGIGSPGSPGVSGFTGPTGRTGATGAMGIQVQSIHRRVVRQAGCPGKYTMVHKIVLFLILLFFTITLANRLPTNFNNPLCDVVHDESVNIY